MGHENGGWMNADQRSATESDSRCGVASDGNTREGDYVPQLFQVHEEDLAELERVLPQLSEALIPVLDNKTKVQLRRCQSILSNIRWNYGPPQIVIQRSESDE